VALEVQKVIEEDHLLDNVKARGAQLRARLEATVGQHPNVGNIRGRGLFQGIEFVADRASKTPFAPNQLINTRIKNEAMQRGLLVYPTGGTADGVSGDHVILAPPYICTAQEIDEIADLFDATVNAVFAAL
jgi:adenosylmethionine-8-amino-7-oxononanoate aminotransferase